jgi:hypothetical protein
VVEGSHVFATCDAAAVADATDGECFGLTEGAARIDVDGDAVPVWAERDSWAFVQSLGWHIAEAATMALDDGANFTDVPLRVEAESFVIPVTNVVYNLFAPFDLFDLGLDDGIYDPAICPEAASGSPLGCIPVRTFRLRIGPVGFTAVPGELLPELAHGFPSDPQWTTEAVDPSARGPGATYFPQHDPNCNDIVYADCQAEMSLGACDCTHAHAWPYTLSHDPAQRPLLEAWDDSPVSYRAIIGMADNYLSYIIPEPDFNASVSLLTDDGDHYEDTVTPTGVFATRLQQAQATINTRW